MAGEAGPRVLLGNLGPIMRLGMDRVLSEEGCQAVGQEDRPSAIVGARPDVVVLDTVPRLRPHRGAAPRRTEQPARPPVKE